MQWVWWGPCLWQCSTESHHVGPYKWDPWPLPHLQDVHKHGPKFLFMTSQSLLLIFFLDYFWRVSWWGEGYETLVKTKCVKTMTFCLVWGFLAEWLIQSGFIFNVKASLPVNLFDSKLLNKLNSQHMKLKIRWLGFFFVNVDVFVAL